MAKTPKPKPLNAGKQDKGTTHTAQKQAFAAYLYRNIATCSMVSAAIGIPQKCLTRYKRQMEQAGTLIVHYKGTCQLTGSNGVQYLTCIPELLKGGKHGI